MLDGASPVEYPLVYMHSYEENVTHTSPPWFAMHHHHTTYQALPIQHISAEGNYETMSPCNYLQETENPGKL